MKIKKRNKKPRVRDATVDELAVFDAFLKKHETPSESYQEYSEYLLFIEIIWNYTLSDWRWGMNDLDRLRKQYEGDDAFELVEAIIEDRNAGIEDAAFYVAARPRLNKAGDWTYNLKIPLVDATRETASE